LPADRHSGLLNAMRLAKGFLATAEMPADDRYRSYLQVLDRQTVSTLLMQPDAAQADPLALAFADAGNEDLLNRMFAVDAETQLPDDLLMLTDKMSMAVSLECRVPLLDHQLVELAAAMPTAIKVRGGRLKHVLKESLGDLLPNDILNRKKRGFGTLASPPARTRRGAVARLVPAIRGGPVSGRPRGQPHRRHRRIAGHDEP
jgi:asparagine synthase (glutamine-hydrolysing)